jgi:hypothetical protein
LNAQQLWGKGTFYLFLIKDTKFIRKSIKKHNKTAYLYT